MQQHMQQQSDSNAENRRVVARRSRKRGRLPLPVAVTALGSAAALLSWLLLTRRCKPGRDSSSCSSIDMFAPVLNDVATDLVNPPAFVLGNIGPLPESFKPQIQAYYTSLVPLATATPTDAVFDTALALARSTPRWEISHEDKQAGLIQGVATTALWRFKDDFIIRIAESDGQTKVDMRSRSRVGRGDMGANAARIESFLKALGGKLAAGTT